MDARFLKLEEAKGYLSYNQPMGMGRVTGALTCLMACASALSLNLKSTMCVVIGAMVAIVSIAPQANFRAREGLPDVVQARVALAPCGIAPPAPRSLGPIHLPQNTMTYRVRDNAISSWAIQLAQLRPLTSLRVPAGLKPGWRCRLIGKPSCGLGSTNRLVLVT